MRLSLLAACVIVAAIPASAWSEETLAGAVEQAHAQLWKDRVSAHGIILDFVGEIPTSEDCTLGKPNAIGWWSPIENGPMFTGLYLPAACERARRSGAAADKAQAQRLAAGLMKCASVSDVPGFIARGVGTDGKCHYPLGSDDQTHPWFYGLQAYVKSGIPSADERVQIVKKMSEVADVLETTGWKCPCDGAFRGEFRGGFQGHLFRDAVRYLFLLRAIYDVTEDRVWLARYQRALAERPAGSELTRAEICAAGYLPDRHAIKNLDEHQLWIYVGSQGSLAKLAAWETADALKAQYRAGLTLNARSALDSVDGCTKFDNADEQAFGHADWRGGYPHWVAQKTQAEAEALSKAGDKAKLGTRKGYEVRFMRNPLAAAAIVALAGDNTGRDKVEQAIRHYDYRKVYMSEFFLAEVAYFALSEGK